MRITAAQDEGDDCRDPQQVFPGIERRLNRPEVTKRPDLTHKRTNRERLGEAIQENQPVVRERLAGDVVLAVSGTT